jgi:putative two-component system response regulator
MENVPFSPPNILIVDDVNSNLVVLSEMLRKAGYISRPVTSARQAVNAIEALTPDLILMDISMPEIDGFLFCKMLKKNSNTRDIPVIFISALNSIEEKIKGFKVGAVDYISKPFETEEITLRINTHLQLYKMKQELEVYNKKLYKIINDQIRKLYIEQKNMVSALVLLASKSGINQSKHLDNVGKNSRLLAMSLQMSMEFKDQITNNFIDAIDLAAPLHDIGKLIISSSNIPNTADLSKKNTELMKSHTTVGAELLEEIYTMNIHNEFLKLAIEIAGCHHEQWNGCGYPKGLKGINIPLGARIVSIVNEYDRLTNGEKDGQVYSHEKSMEIINEQAGILYDPAIITVFNKIQHQLKNKSHFT